MSILIRIRACEGLYTNSLHNAAAEAAALGETLEDRTTLSRWIREDGTLDRHRI